MFLSLGEIMEHYFFLYSLKYETFDTFSLQILNFKVEYLKIFIVKMIYIYDVYSRGGPERGFISDCCYLVSIYPQRECIRRWQELLRIEFLQSHLCNMCAKKSRFF